VTEYLYEKTDFAYIDEIIQELTCTAYTDHFDVVSIHTRDDWVSPGVLLVHVYMERKDLYLSHDYTFRSNGERVSDNPTRSMRTKVRNRYRQLVLKMERRLNRTQPDAEGFYRRPVYHD
jgi:hypothetical protein